MKKVLLVAVLFLVTTVAAFAQKGDIGISVGVEGALPVGDWSDGYSIGVGGSLKGLYGISDAGQVTLTVGYDRFGVKDFDGSLSLVPVLAGYRHTFSSLYVEPQIGISAQKSKIEMGEFGDVSASTTDFSFAIGAGYLVGPMDLGLRYQNISASGGSLGFLALRVAYNFSL